MQQREALLPEHAGISNWYDTKTESSPPAAEVLCCTLGLHCEAVPEFHVRSPTGSREGDQY